MTTTEAPYGLTACTRCEGGGQVWRDSRGMKLTGTFTVCRGCGGTGQRPRRQHEARAVAVHNARLLFKRDRRSDPATAPLEEIEACYVAFVATAPEDNIGAQFWRRAGEYQRAMFRRDLYAWQNEAREEAHRGAHPAPENRRGSGGLRRPSRRGDH